MKNLGKTLKWASMLGCAVLLGSPLASWAADAAPPASPHTFTANIGAVNNYIFRGLTQTWDHPAAQGGIDYAHDSGLYAGLWASNISNKYIAGGSAEIDLYGGYNGKFNPDWTWTVGLIGYLYPGANYKDITPVAGANQNYNTLEANAGIGYKWITGKVSIALTDYYGANVKTGYRDDSKGTSYWDLTANVPLPESIFTKDVTMPLHVGYTNVTTELAPANANAAGATNPDYADYKVGITKAFDGGISLSAAYLYADNTRMYDNTVSLKGGSEKRDLGGSNVVVSLVKTF
ncbi:MAG: TorF family putative porin [Magnetococcus sp. YQC-9]